MSKSAYERHLIENEVIFRKYNERIKKGFDTIKRVAKEDNQEHLIPVYDVPLKFFCECSDEKCTERIAIKPSEYTEIHKERDQFILVPGHEVENIERVIAEAAGFCIAKKYNMPPEDAKRLNPTTIS